MSNFDESIHQIWIYKKYRKNKNKIIHEKIHTWGHSEINFTLNEQNSIFSKFNSLVLISPEKSNIQIYIYIYALHFSFLERAINAFLSLTLRGSSFSILASQPEEKYVYYTLSKKIDGARAHVPKERYVSRATSISIAVLARLPSRHACKNSSTL